MRIPSMVAFAAALVPLASSAASGPGQGGKLILGADRLVEVIAYTAIGNGSGSFSSTQKTASISLFGGIGLAQSFYNVPRLAFDYAVNANLTLGGAAFLYLMLSNTRSSGSSSSDLAKLSVMGVAPRVGWVLPVSGKAWFWPRAGITWAALTTSPPAGSSNTTSQLAANLEGMFVLSPFEHIGISLGPELDVPITGSVSSGSSSTDASQFHVGLTAGLDVWF